MGATLWFIGDVNFLATVPSPEGLLAALTLVGGLNQRIWPSSGE